MINEERGLKASKYNNKRKNKSKNSTTRTRGRQKQFWQVELNRLPLAEVMALIEVPLNSYIYRFRRLTWPEEIRLPFKHNEDQRKTVMSHALTDISGLTVTVPQALEILKKLPDAIFWRIWILYRGNLPDERYYTAGGLYEAPDQVAYQKRIQHDDDAVEGRADEATALVQRRFGGAGVEDAEDISRQMFLKARDEGKLIPARSDSRNG